VPTTLIWGQRSGTWTLFDTLTAQSHMQVQDVGARIGPDVRPEPDEGVTLMDLLRAIAPRRTAHAHCDIPCGIYDPVQARIEAESCYRIIEKYNASSDEVFRARCLIVKEERAELAKHHIDVLWSDYFKPDHLAAFPDIQDTCWKAAKQASLVKRTVDLEEARKLLTLIDQIDAAWKGTGGPAATRLPA